uniref:Uncharacterized protein n=1 Tax=Anguilla anguilla TaxID=7936 RepID=A0A0E9VLN0_ANGAN
MKPAALLGPIKIIKNIRIIKCCIVVKGEFSLEKCSSFRVMSS